MEVADVSPGTLPDLFASRPAIVHGRYVGPPASKVTLAASSGKERVRATALARSATVGSGVVSTLWARARVGDLQYQYAIDGDPSLVDAITTLGLEHRLVTPYTSFVAVDRTRKVGKGDPKRVVQPVEGPEGVDLEMAGAEQAQAMMSVGGGIAYAESYDGAPEMTMREAMEPGVAYERRARGGCAHCGSRGRDDLAALLLPLGVFGLRRRRRWRARRGS
jgi:hypothetical protein